jgi:uncharacterized protein (TIGR00369 family)
MTGERKSHSDAGLKLLRQVFAEGGFGTGIGRTLGIKGVSVDPGMVVLSGNPTEDHQNPFGSVHGGYIATLLDASMALALQTVVDPGTLYSTTDLHINYLRGVKVNDGEVRAEARIVDVGRARALAEARLTGPDGQLRAIATGAFAVRMVP